MRTSRDLEHGGDFRDRSASNLIERKKTESCIQSTSRRYVARSRSVPCFRGDLQWQGRRENNAGRLLRALCGGYGRKEDRQLTIIYIRPKALDISSAKYVAILLKSAIFGQGNRYFWALKSAKIFRTYIGASGGFGLQHSWHVPSQEMGKKGRRENLGEPRACTKVLRAHPRHPFKLPEENNNIWLLVAGPCKSIFSTRSIGDV